MHLFKEMLTFQFNLFLFQFPSLSQIYHILCKFGIKIHLITTSQTVDVLICHYIYIHIYIYIYTHTHTHNKQNTPIKNISRNRHAHAKVYMLIDLWVSIYKYFLV